MGARCSLATLIKPEPRIKVRGNLKTRPLSAIFVSILFAQRRYFPESSAFTFGGSANVGQCRHNAICVRRPSDGIPATGVRPRPCPRPATLLHSLGGELSLHRAPLSARGGARGAASDDRGAERAQREAAGVGGAVPLRQSVANLCLAAPLRARRGDRGCGSRSHPVLPHARNPS